MSPSRTLADHFSITASWPFPFAITCNFRVGAEPVELGRTKRSSFRSRGLASAVAEGIQFPQLLASLNGT